MKAKFLLAALLLNLIGMNVRADVYQPEFSTAGFFTLEGTGREVLSMNPAWRFVKGDVTGAEAAIFDDSAWEAVSLPHGIDYLPTEASGCVNYQGVVWYRKHFKADKAWMGRKTFLHFEAIMGKCRVYVNGMQVTEHFGGYLPVVADISDLLRYDEDNVIAVWADNSDDPAYPPGKNQNVLDFTYCGGIYRDCWLVIHDKVYITDANYENEPAGGGLLVACDNVSEKSADVLLQLHVRDEASQTFHGYVEFELFASDGRRVAKAREKLTLAASEATHVKLMLKVNDPQLWTPSKPVLYQLLVRVKNNRGDVLDGYRQRIGIRSFEFRGSEGFFLNGKHYDKPLIGANRHQDFAVLGNAVPNSIHWRDAKKLKDVGLEVIRNAHCPQDPAFLDACDELGLLVLNNTPGWQFWNDDPIFAQRVYTDIRNLVRRDRNHACQWLWEPILNETHYPADFAEKALQTVTEEYPYPSCYCGSDSHARGAEMFPVQFCHPQGMRDAHSSGDSTKTYFTREWGDNVDDWSSHNSPSRVSRAWGEVPMLVQAQHYAKPDYNVTSYDQLYRQLASHIGGALWHSFDHQRGYHPDPFYGGIMDAFRQPKYSYYMFMAQRPPVKTDALAETGPMVHIAHEMTPFSPKDVTVYSNCDEVRLTFCEGGKTQTYTKDTSIGGMPSPVITFPGMYDFMVDKGLDGRGHGDKVWLFAEGLINGEVVATHKVFPSRRPEQLLLWVDDEATPLRADGSDCVVVVAAIADRNGNIKRLNNDFIHFKIEGEGNLLGDASINANPAPVRWGETAALVQATTTPGKITIYASLLYQGTHKAKDAVLELESVPAAHTLWYEDELLESWKGQSGEQCRNSAFGGKVTGDVDASALDAVSRQQAEFGE